MFNDNFLKLLEFLASKNITISLQYVYPNTEGKILGWDFGSGAKSFMYVVPIHSTSIKIYARYDVSHEFEITDNVDDYIEELLTFFKDKIMYYPCKDFCSSDWMDLMKEYGVF